MIGVEESDMRRGLLDGLVIVTGGVLGFVLTFAGFILWIRLHEAYYSGPPEWDAFTVFSCRALLAF
jgi:hypothetical protein